MIILSTSSSVILSAVRLYSLAFLGDSGLGEIDFQPLAGVGQFTLQLADADPPGSGGTELQAMTDNPACVGVVACVRADMSALSADAAYPPRFGRHGNSRVPDHGLPVARKSSPSASPPSCLQRQLINVPLVYHRAFVRDGP